MRYTNVNSDISSNNILQGIGDSSILSQIEEDEMKRPIARKVLADRHIYYSRPMPISTGLPVLSDLGEARAGNHKHRGDIMPGIYRAPEVILNMDWDCKVDIWSIGVVASLDFISHIVSKLMGLGLGFGARSPSLFCEEKPGPRRRTAPSGNGVTYGTSSSRVPCQK